MSKRVEKLKLMLVLGDGPSMFFFSEFLNVGVSHNASYIYIYIYIALYHHSTPVLLN